MTMHRRPFRRRGLTLVELLIVVAVLAVLATLVAPSVRDLVLMQRLRSINSQLVTDLQFARSEAVARGVMVRFGFNLGASGQTCYVIYAQAASFGARCNCSQGAGSACSGITGATELRTVSVLRSSGVAFADPDPADPIDPATAWLAFDPVTGGLMTSPTDVAPGPLALFAIQTRIDAPRRLRTSINQTGRPSVCAPSGAEQRTQVTPC
jgi:type IV fimbrial biogenesis protein FimT